jgi:hypothetical protein
LPFTAEVIVFTILSRRGIRHWFELVLCYTSASSTALFSPSSGIFPVVVVVVVIVVVTAAAVLVLIFTSYFSIYTF